MISLHFIKTPEKRRIIEELNEKFGITNLPYLLIEAGKEKMRAYSGSLSKEELIKLNSIMRIEVIGLYLLRKEDGGTRLSFDASTILKNQISKSILEINEQEFHDWIRGKNITTKSKKGVYVVSYKGNFLGCGKSNSEVLFNHVPKDRRLRN